MNDATRAPANQPDAMTPALGERECRQEIDPSDIVYFRFSAGGWSQEHTSLEVIRDERGCTMIASKGPLATWDGGPKRTERRKELSEADFTAFCEELIKIGVFGWEEYYDACVLDGETWNIEARDSSGRSFESAGCNAYPKGFEKLRRLVKTSVDLR